jgi:O-antigen/teichoic acid export membrane protein
MRLSSSNILKHPLFQKSILYTITDAVNKAIPFLLLPFLTYYLSPADYGIVANYNVYISILLIFVGLNLNGALASNFYHLTKKEAAAYISNLFIIILLATVIVGVIVGITADFISAMTSILPSFLMMGILVAASQAVTQINLDLWRFEEKPLAFGIYQILQSLINIGLTIFFLASLKMTWTGRVWAMIIASLLFLFISLFVLAKRGYIKMKLEKRYVKDALRFGLPMIPHTLGIWIRTGIDRIYITKFYGVAESGLYSTGFQFGLLLSFLVMAFHNAFVPFVYKQLVNNEEEQKRKIVKFTYIYMGGVLVLAAIFTLISSFIIHHFLSDRYLQSEKYVSWAMFTQAFQGMYLMVGIYIFYAKRTAKLAIVTSVLSVLQLILSYLLVKFVGPMGAAYSSLFVCVLNFILVWYLSVRIYDMPWFKSKRA